MMQDFETSDNVVRFEPELPEVAKLSLQDGDILLVTVPTEWTPEKIHRLHEALSVMIDRAGHRVPVLYSTPEVEFKIVRKEPKEEAGAN